MKVVRQAGGERHVAWGANVGMWGNVNPRPPFHAFHAIRGCNRRVAATRQMSAFNSLDHDEAVIGGREIRKEMIRI